MGKLPKSTKSYRTYRLEVPNELWDKFKACLRKVYWKEESTISQGVIKLMEEFINKNINA